MALTVGKKYTVVFHLKNNADGPPWTFSYILDSFNFSETFSYDTGFVTKTVVTKNQVNPGVNYAVDNPPGTNPDPTNQDGLIVTVVFFYPVGSDPNLTTKTIAQFFQDAKTAAGY